MRLSEFDETEVQELLAFRVLHSAELAAFEISLATESPIGARAM
jgi:hypothetical protein